MIAASLDLTAASGLPLSLPCWKAEALASPPGVRSTPALYSARTWASVQGGSSCRNTGQKPNGPGK